MPYMDPRITPYRKDLAADWLEGKVEAARFASGTRMQVCDPVTDIRHAPACDAPLDSQALLGELFTVYEFNNEGWAWGQLETDGYVGYMSSSALSDTINEPTHWVCVRSSFTYPAPEIKHQPVRAIPYGAGLSVLETQGEFCKLTDGRFAWSRHLRKIGDFADDFVSVCEAMLSVPYLWGGTSACGLDCSGLIYTGLKAAGIKTARDSDLLERSFRTDLGSLASGDLQRGDLVFWKGHIGVMRDADTLLHANGYHMSVVSEPLGEAVKRIAHLYARPTSWRRPASLSANWFSDKNARLNKKIEHLE